MERQPASSPTNAAHPDPTPQRPSSASQHGPEANPSASSASSSLRFPKPEGSYLLAHWVTSSSTGNAADTMQSSAVLDETSSLADSAYEVISSTDGESQDGLGLHSLVPSIADTFDLPPWNDGGSLNGRDVPDDDDDDDADDDDDDNGPMLRPSGFATLTRNTPGHSQLYAAAGRDSAAWPSPADSIRYTEQALCNPSTQSLSTLDYDSSPGGDSTGSGHHANSPLVHSIEFNEDAGVTVNLDKVSVKHTIREFSEAESTIIAANMGIVDKPPRRMAATVRQTMSHRCLATDKPLRVLYVGSEAVANDITYKISSALLASAPPQSAGAPGAGGSASEHRHASTPGVYNILPISSFGSAKVPEIDEIQLMGVSDYYIQVERCVKAEETVYQGGAFPSDTVYSIELDSGNSYVSVFHPRGSTVSPPWALPHVAIFYISGNDSRKAEATRNAAWAFMARHSVPSIFISHAQTFSRSPSAGRWQNCIEQAALHLCLESRDPARPMAPARLPIDLMSFLNIDARQMNRNLAYLTGLQDAPPETSGKGRPGNSSKTAADSSPRSTAGVEGVVLGLLQSARLLKQGRDPRPQAARTAAAILSLARTHLWGLLVSVFLTAVVSSSLLYPPFSSSWRGVYPSPWRASFASDSTLIAPATAGTTAAAAAAAASLAKPGSSLAASLSSPSTSTATAASSVCSVPSVAPTVTISFVTTKTVEVLVSEPTKAHKTQATFGGLLTDGSYHMKRGAQSARAVSDTEIKSTGCSIQVHSSHEILVKVPSATKTQWLAKGAIDIDVWRGQTVLKSKLSTSDEGLIIEIDKKEAYGVMNVSIVTTRRPKINETFAVDFGKPTAARLLQAALRPWQDLAWAAAGAGLEAASHAKEAVAAHVHDAVHDAGHPTVPSSANVFFNSTSQMLQSLSARVRGLQEDVAKGYKRLRTSEAAEEAAETAARRVRSFFDKDWLALARERVRLPTMGRGSTSSIRRDAALAVRRAQIASKLWWLRVQGKKEEHDRYAAKAAKYLCDLEGGAKPGQASEKDTPNTRRGAGRPALWPW